MSIGSLLNSLWRDKVTRRSLWIEKSGGQSTLTQLTVRSIVGLCISFSLHSITWKLFNREYFCIVLIKTYPVKCWLPTTNEAIYLKFMFTVTKIFVVVESFCRTFLRGVNRGSLTTVPDEFSCTLSNHDI